MARVSQQRNLVVIVVGAVLLVLVGAQFVKTVPPGRIGVATLFGNVRPVGYSQGIHIPVNPLYRWTMYDARQKTHLETANVPSQDQLQTKLDVSVQYRIDGVMAPDILEQTGDEVAAVRVHLIPKLRSLLREQAVERERAELERVRTELQQHVARAAAGREAAEQEAARKRILADAQAYEITQINNAIARNQAYIQLQSLEALKAISKDPASKVYFLDGSSPSPLPLMHLGDIKQ
ncbi:MAG: SPFH domain-containing protein [Gammaproteobacteria bacterium]|nr:SPFH domain-containing protein [Gammaproteobacteria bacterium]